MTARAGGLSGCAGLVMRDDADHDFDAVATGDHEVRGQRGSRDLDVGSTENINGPNSLQLYERLIRSFCANVCLFLKMA